MTQSFSQKNKTIHGPIYTPFSIKYQTSSIPIIHIYPHPEYHPINKTITIQLPRNTNKIIISWNPMIKKEHITRNPTKDSHLPITSNSIDKNNNTKIKIGWPKNINHKAQPNKSQISLELKADKKVNTAIPPKSPSNNSQETPN